MSGRRMIRQNWIVELGRDPAAPPATGPIGRGGSQIEISARVRITPQTDEGAAGSVENEPLVRDIRRKVAAALSRLTENEREFIIRYYYMGQSLQDMAAKTRRATHKLEALHNRARRKLRGQLAAFVRSRFGIEVSPSPGCPICNSAYRAEIDNAIRCRDPRKPWRPLIRLIRNRYGLHGVSPALLVGHEKYH